MIPKLAPRTIEELLKHMDGPQPVVIGSQYPRRLARHALVAFDRPFRPRQPRLTDKGRVFIGRVLARQADQLSDPQ